jgi:toxin ParE1/3/4
MPAIAFHTDAAEEMQAAAASYAIRAPGLGDAFLDEIEQGLRRIQELPRLWPVYEGEYRRYLLQRFPYGLIYRIDPEEIFILAVAHLHRHPGYWKNRA